MKQEHVNFDIIRENFCIYQVDNGQILKVKRTLLDVVNDKSGDEKPKAGLSIKDISQVITPSDIDASNFDYADLDRVTEKDQVREMKITTLQEPINIYETKNFIILIAPHIQKIFLTNKKDQANTPILRYTMGASVSVIEKTSLLIPANEQVDKTG